MAILPDILTLSTYYEMGGFVMPALVIVAVLLWYALTYRVLNLKTTDAGPRELVKKAQKKTLESEAVTARGAMMAIAAAQKAESRVQLKSILNERFQILRSETGRYRSLVRSLVAAAPLLGLLGTVDGMIETFRALGDMALFSQSGGIAGGISRALFTTQVGLAISIPGLMLGRMVEQKQQKIIRDLDQIKDLVCADKFGV